MSISICVISMLALSGCGCNKKKKKSTVESKAPVSRLEDKEYLAALQAHREDQKVVANERNQLAKEMEKVAARVKSTLKPDASEEEVKAALEKDGEWQELLKKLEQANQDVQDVLAEARETVRKRLLKEQAESKAAGKSQR